MWQVHTWTMLIQTTIEKSLMLVTPHATVPERDERTKDANLEALVP